MRSDAGGNLGATADGDTPGVGIFWRVGTKRDGKLVSHVVPLGQAEEYGEFLTHPSGHYDVWESWKAAGVPELRRIGLPDEIADTEYEEHPRARVVYHRARGEFTIYADRRLQDRATIANVAALFGIGRQHYLVRSDSHYVVSATF